MAAGAGDGHSHHAARDDIYPVVNDVVDVIDEPAAKRQVTQSCQRTLVAVTREQVGGDLLLDEFVIRQIFIEGANYVIPIRVRVGVMPVLLSDVPPRVRIAGHIEPVPAPTLAVLRG